MTKYLVETNSVSETVDAESAEDALSKSSFASKHDPAVVTLLTDERPAQLALAKSQLADAARAAVIAEREAQQAADEAEKVSAALQLAVDAHKAADAELGVTLQDAKLAVEAIAQAHAETARRVVDAKQKLAEAQAEEAGLKSAQVSAANAVTAAVSKHQVAADALAVAARKAAELELSLASEQAKP